MQRDVTAHPAPGGDVSRAPLFSIVMPAYGTERYLARAISCVVAQSERDWELIVVDDCSPDGVGRIARAFAARDARIRVVTHRENLGLSAARNTGIAEARGTWLWMPDSDDSFDYDLLARVREAIGQVDGGPDCVVFGYEERYRDERGRLVAARAVRPEHPGCFPRPADWHGLVASLERSTLLGYAWNKVYRLARVRDLGLSFERVRLIEDFAFAVRYLRDARSLVVLDACPYHYEKRRGRSLTGANAFSAREYWSLHERRVGELVGLLEGWGELDDESAGILGGLYVRFVVSALERTHFPGESWGGRERRAFLAGLRSTELYRRLVPVARSDGGRAVEAAIRALRSGHDEAMLAIALVAYLAQTHLYGVFVRVRSER